ncbi:aminoglycoside phosphotransferase family protein [Nonomuraea sp. NPDC050663]|uniref:aminoglycoside phosphotransferase family protein n=1 Tax=Nonomuraea sp. NPDC050663 TaxID=3364370 RepID=UPI0037A55770
MKMHADELTVVPETVRALVAGQFPHWRGLPVRRVPGEGTVNSIFRIGDGLAARFPLEPKDPDEARDWLEREAEASRELAAATSFPTPEPVAIGEPGEGYPMPWSVQTWLPGVVASRADAGGSEGLARDLAEFVAGLRALDTRGRTFSGGGRGGRLSDHDEWVETCLRRSEELFDVPRLRRLWAEMRELPREAPDVMNHGDLIPGNVLVFGGRLAGVLDGGGFGPADPALDLVGAWHLLEAGPREVLRRELGSDDLEWARGRAWAFQQALGAAWYYVESNPAMSGMGRTTIARILG